MDLTEITCLVSARDLYRKKAQDTLLSLEVATTGECAAWTGWDCKGLLTLFGILQQWGYEMSQHCPKLCPKKCVQNKHSLRLAIKD